MAAPAGLFSAIVIVFEPVVATGLLLGGGSTSMVRRSVSSWGSGQALSAAIRSKMNGASLIGGQSGIHTSTRSSLVISPVIPDLILR